METLSSSAICPLKHARKSRTFRTNASYARWNEARQAWGRIVSHCRNIMRQSTLWIDTDDPTAQAALDELRQCVYAFPRSLWAHLSDPTKEPRFEQDIRAAMGDAATEKHDEEDLAAHAGAILAEESHLAQAVEGDARAGAARGAQPVARAVVQVKRLERLQFA